MIFANWIYLAPQFMTMESQLILTTFIDRNFEQAHEMQKAISQDATMVEGIVNGTIDRKTVKDWMRSYGLLQGQTTEARNNLADTFIAFSQEYKNQRNPEISALFQQLHGRLRAVKNKKNKPNNRSWLSATSKLLWCMFPHDVVIFDSFVERCILVLQCIEPDLMKLDRLSGKPSSKSEDFLALSTEYYLRYEALVKKIMELYQAQIKRLKNTVPDPYPYDIRLIDKLLWLMEYQGKEYKFSEGKFFEESKGESDQA